MALRKCVFVEPCHDQVVPIPFDEMGDDNPFKKYIKYVSVVGNYERFEEKEALVRCGSSRLGKEPSDEFCVFVNHLVNPLCANYITGNVSDAIFTFKKTIKDKTWYYSTDSYNYPVEYYDFSQDKETGELVGFYTLDENGWIDIALSFNDLDELPENYVVVIIEKDTQVAYPHPHFGIQNPLVKKYSNSGLHLIWKNFHINGWNLPNITNRLAEAHGDPDEYVKILNETLDCRIVTKVEVINTLKRYCAPDLSSPLSLNNYPDDNVVAALRAELTELAPKGRCDVISEKAPTLFVKKVKKPTMGSRVGAWTCAFRASENHEYGDIVNDSAYYMTTEDCTVYLRSNITHILGTMSKYCSFKSEERMTVDGEPYRTTGYRVIHESKPAVVKESSLTRGEPITPLYAAIEGSIITLTNKFTTSEGTFYSTNSGGDVYQDTDLEEEELPW